MSRVLVIETIEYEMPTTQEEIKATMNELETLREVFLHGLRQARLKIMHYCQHPNKETHPGPYGMLWLVCSDCGRSWESSGETPPESEK